MLNTNPVTQIQYHNVIDLRTLFFVAGTLISACACTSNSSVETTTPRQLTFSGSETEQIRECETVSVLAPDQTTVSYVGNIWREEVDGDEQFTQHWNQVTPENAGKWGEVERIRDEMYWDRLDAAVAYAQNNNFNYKFHTLVWGANQPEWLVNQSAEQQIVELEQWMNQLSQRFPDMHQIDVVNEPLHAPPSYISALTQLNNSPQPPSKWTWVVNTFAQARRVFPNSELLLNDFDILRSNENTENYLEIIKLLQANALIDGIGLQAHFLEETSVDQIQSNLTKLGSTGLPLYISEFDLNIADDQLQLERMQQLFSLFYTSEYVKGITFWGYRENQLWQANARLINDDGTKRPAMKWLECYLK